MPARNKRWLGFTRLRSGLVSAWTRLRTRIHYIRTFLRPDVVVLEGRTESGRALSILRAGIADRKADYFFSGQVLTELRSERGLGRAWLWALPALANQLSCAFILYRTSRRRAALARRILRRIDDDAFYLPLFVGATIDVTDRTRLLRSNSLRDDVRKVRNRGFQFSISRRKQDLDVFMRRYHDPYVAKAHGFDALRGDIQRLLALCTGDEIPQPWLLLKVELEGEWFAGDLLVSGAGEAALMETGVKDADPTLVKRGAIQAAHWLSLEYLRSQGHKRVNLMHSRPFLTNGVLQYKLKFSPVIKPTSHHGFLLLPNQESEVAREVLLREPFLAFRGDSLRAVWFALDAEASPDTSRVPVDRLAIAGIADVEQVVLRHAH